jgi:hypothetical protein
MENSSQGLQGSRLRSLIPPGKFTDRLALQPASRTPHMSAWTTSPWRRKYDFHNLRKGPRKGCNFPYPDKLEMPLSTKTACDIAPDDQISVFSALYAGSGRVRSPSPALRLEVEEPRTGEYQTETSSMSLRDAAEHLRPPFLRVSFTVPSVATALF